MTNVLHNYKQIFYFNFRVTPYATVMQACTYAQPLFPCPKSTLPQEGKYRLETEFYIIVTLV